MQRSFGGLEKETKSKSSWLHSRSPAHCQQSRSQFVKPERKIELENIIKEMKSLSASPKEERSGLTFNSGGGAQTNNVKSGSGQQISNITTVTTQTFHFDKDYEKALGPEHPSTLNTINSLGISIETRVS